MYGKRPPLDEEKSLWEATLAAEGVTTAAGTAAGDNFIDAALAGAGDNSFVSMLAVLYPGQPQRVDSMYITAFDNVAGRVTLAGAYKGVALAIPAGVPYKIVTFRFVPAEVAALTALVQALMLDVGDASTAVLGSLFGILGDPAVGEDLATRIGYEGALSIANKLTAARALLLDEITALRMAELDPANIPTDLAAIIAYVDELETRLSAIRAGYLDELAAANIPADTDPKVMVRLQIKATTIDLNQAAATYVLFTANTQDVVVEKLVLRMPNSALAAPFTYLTIQTDDTTPIVLIDATAGAVGNLTAEAQLAWTGAILLDAGTAATIGLTIAVAFGGAATVADVIAEYRAVVAGGTL